MSVRWRFLNSDRVEVTPEDRKHAWVDLLAAEMQSVPRYDAFRTNVSRSNFEHFDYKTPIVYEIAARTVLINNEFFNKILNRPRHAATPAVIRPIQIFFAFICCVLLSIVAAYVSDDGRGGGGSARAPVTSKTR
uniref:Orf-78 protein n=1 Tax=Lymantria dispar multicapsid nuclear polyhedrosis virus TaxID=10449 RepID=A0A0D3QVT6_NPVLD|nr:orf-78 protein [Lymantria dispar multiple nucleopolyhedrovirus]AMO27576.1 PIF-6 [Lymantria dispar multiple nucleopolyhedrovirus]AQQ80099.1 hypothetical protein [Lymantria dispar multiple nucleopolyhedrovirus]